MRASHTVRPVFDDPNLVSSARLIPLLRLAETAGLHASLEAGLTVASPHAAAKTMCVIGGMLAGADSIDDLALLRHGAVTRVMGGVRAPSTLGTFLRSFTHGHVQQLDRAGGQLLTAQATRIPALLGAQPGSSPGSSLTMIDVDDTVREVHGYAKQAAAFGYTHQRGLNVQLATITGPGAAPVIARARLRRGNVASQTGAGRMLAQAITTAKAAMAAAKVGGPVLARADSAYYGLPFAGTAVRHGVNFSITARMNPSLRAAIAAIDDDAWTSIHYPNAVFDDVEQRWISDAEIAEVPYLAFARRDRSSRPGIACRLVVRRVRRLQPLAHDGSDQGELFATWRHHAFITDTDPALLDTAAADLAHRGHAIVEQVIAELKAGPLAHLPSGRYAANAAWVACAVIAFNLARAAAVAAAMPTARWATVRTRIINVAARLARTGRRHVLHLPRGWAWATHWDRLWRTATTTATATATATGPPAAVTT